MIVSGPCGAFASTWLLPYDEIAESVTLPAGSYAVTRQK
jgi:hypothetical protein